MTITSKEYISKLRVLRAYTLWIARNIGSAVDEMRDGREDLSRIDVQSCREITEALFSKLLEIENCSIEY